ncbi:MAG: hypothetical protein AAF183_23395 [Pseudomonadota bacterium]
MTGLDVPTDASTDNFDVAVFRFSEINDVFGAPSVYDVLFEARDQSAAITGLSIEVFDGDVVGILGSRGANSANSYGAGGFTTMIDGEATTLNRLVLQDDLRTRMFPTATDLGSDDDGSI